MGVYSHLKIFHFKEKIDSLPANKPILAPIHIRLKPTNYCNHNCVYCCYRNQFSMQIGNDISLKDSIPKEKMIEIIDDFGAIGVKAVTFSGGGEPLCYPHISDSLEGLAYHEIKIAMLTNGALLKNDVADILAENAEWIRISIDGWDSESYSKYRGIGLDAYGKVMENIRKFNIIKKKCQCGISLIIDKANHAHVHEMIRNFRDLGIDSVKASGVVMDDSAFKSNQYHRPIFNAVKEQLERSINEFGGPGFEIFDAYHELEETYNNTYNWCPQCQCLAIVGADCNVYSCHDKAYNKFGIIGSIKNQSFKQLWNDGKEKFFRINPSIDCQHHCAETFKNRNIIEYLESNPDHREFV
jgi:MoaA/NifB/PqqE/SkfB family radical SAM enzyme